MHYWVKIIQLHEYKSTWPLQVPLYIALPFISVLLIIFAWACGSNQTDLFNIAATLQIYFDYDFMAAKASTSYPDFIGAILGIGLITSGWGINVAHELTHRTSSPIAMFVGRWLLSMSCTADFAIEHVYGHHVHVGTDKDPASAKKGENVYSFFFRSTIYGHINAWKLEIKKLKKRNHSIFSIHNWMFRGYMMSLVWVGLFYNAAGGFGIALFFAQALFAKFILEVVNYMEHYGLVRNSNEAVQQHHSWNTNRRMSHMILFTLTRHSAHHEQGDLPYWVLNPYINAPQMPYGYLSTIFVCLVPSLWYRVINKSLIQWENNHGIGDKSKS